MLHESAHLFAAKMLGFSPYAVTVGKGPILFQGHVRGIEVRIHWFPFVGMVRGKRLPLLGLSWKGSLFSIAGVLSDTVIMISLLKLAGVRLGAPDPSDASVANTVFAILALYQVVVVIANLVPSNHVIEGRTIPNDGRQFFGYLTGRTSRTTMEAYEKTVARYDPNFRISESSFMRDNQPMLMVLSDAEGDFAAGRFAQAVEKYLRIIDQNVIHAAERALILDRLACIPVINGEKSFLSAAVEWSKQAYELFPQCKTIRGTLGSILVEKGDYAEGLALLMPLTSEDNEQIDRALASCYVAKALHHLGNSAEARKWIEAARRCGDFPEVRSRIESELSRTGE